MRYLNKEFANLNDLHKYVVENKDDIIATKKMQYKEADVVNCVLQEQQTNEVNKEQSNPETSTKLYIKAVINTTNLYDSHGDVHINGIWNKSLKEKRKLYLLEEHKHSFDNVISRKVQASAEMMTFKELGFKYEGETQALIFNAEIEKEEHPEMYKRYQKGQVDNHSVGMYYVNLYVCINSEEKWAVDEKKNWDKYISHVSNKEDILYGMFYAVTEAKLIEGSAVLFGSNFVTPTLEVEEKEIEEKEIINAIEPPKDTQTKEHNEPIVITQTWEDVLKALKK
jgi:hypothetical protein